MNSFFSELFELVLEPENGRVNCDKLCFSSVMLGEKPNDRHLKVLLFAVSFIVVCEVSEVKHWKTDQVNQVAELASHIPRGLLHVGLTIEVVGTTVEPMRVSINVELLEVTELVHWMVLEVVVF